MPGRNDKMPGIDKMHGRKDRTCDKINLALTRSKTAASETGNGKESLHVHTVYLVWRLGRKKLSEKLPSQKHFQFSSRRPYKSNVS